VAENIAFPMEWTQKPFEEIEKRVDELLETVGLHHRAHHFAAQLSGGEQQRVAFARALSMIRSLYWLMSQQEIWIQKMETKSFRFSSF
jgi:ABC-type methionine transport system ATPase subunit